MRSRSYNSVKECLVQVRELEAQKKTLTVFSKWIFQLLQVFFKGSYVIVAWDTDSAQRNIEFKVISFMTNAEN